jgi:hypothetical protein
MPKTNIRPLDCLRAPSTRGAAGVATGVWWVVAAAVLVAGCGKAEEPQHGGKSLGKWVAQAKGRDASARLAAYEGLAAFRGNDVAKGALRDAMRGESTDAGERLVAARHLYRATGEADEVVEAAGAAVRRAADSAAGFRAVKEADELFLAGG